MTRVAVVLGETNAVNARDLLLGLQWCDEVVVVSPPGRARDALIALFGPRLEVVEPTRGADLGRLDGVVSFCDQLLPLASEIAAARDLRFAAPDTVRALRDKGVQRARLAAAGLGHVRSMRIECAADWSRAVAKVGCPLVLKPAHGQGSRHTHLALDETAVRTRCEDYFRADSLGADPLVAESYLAGTDRSPFGDYVSVESVVTDGAVHHLGVTGKLPLLPPFRETGQFHPSGLAPAEEAEVLTLTEAALGALGMTEGTGHTEIKMTPDGPRIIEVNGRLGGYVNELYGRVLSADIVEHVTRVACGEAGLGLPRAVAGGVCFQYYHQPPRGARVLRGISGRREVARTPGVASYTPLARAGDVLPSDAGSFDLDLLCGEAATHDEMFRTLQRAREHLGFEFEFDDGVRTVSAAALAGCA